MTKAAAAALRLKSLADFLAHFPSTDPKDPPKGRIWEGWSRDKLKLPQVQCMVVGRERPVSYDALGPSQARVQVTAVGRSMSELEPIVPDIIEALDGEWGLDGETVVYVGAFNGAEHGYEDGMCSISLDFIVTEY